MEVKEFIKWYEEAYYSGDTNTDNYIQAASFLEGYADAKGGNDQMIRIATILRGAANLLSNMKRK